MVSLEVSGKVRKALSLPRFFAPPQDFQREEREKTRIKQKKLSHIYVVFVIQNLKFGTLPWHPVIMVKYGTYKQNWDFFWDQNLGLYSLNKSNVSPLDNVVQKQALSESIQKWKFPLGKQTHNDKHNWIKDYMLFCYNLQCY